MGALGRVAGARRDRKPARARRRPGQIEADFDQVWELVRDRFYDPRLNGLDWQEERARFRPQAASARSREDAAAVDQCDAGEARRLPHPLLHAGRSGLLPARRHFRGRARASRPEPGLPERRRVLSGIGVFTEADDQGRTFITGAIEGAPAHAAGVLVGDEILSADDRPFRPVDSFRGKVGGPVSLRSGARPARRRSRSPSSPADLHPNAMFLRGLKGSARVIAADKARIGYVHVWSYASHRMQSALEDLMADGPLKDADALVWDLRGGWGGAQPQYLDLFNPARAHHSGQGPQRRDRLRRRQMAQAGRHADQRGHAQRQGGARLRIQAIPARRARSAIAPKARCCGHRVPDRRRRAAPARGRGRAGRRPTPRGGRR